jgi:hypothetical protein
LGATLIIWGLRAQPANRVVAVKIRAARSMVTP